MLLNINYLPVHDKTPAEEASPRMLASLAHDINFWVSATATWPSLVKAVFHDP